MIVVDATVLADFLAGESQLWLARTRGLFLRTRDKQVLRECPDVARPMPVV